MASYNLSRVDRFPQGATVGAYPVSNWPSGMVNTAAAPLGSATNEQTMGASSLTFTGLTAGAKYVAYASVGGDHRYVAFTAAEDLSQVDGITLDPDTTFAADSDERVATQKATRAYADRANSVGTSQIGSLPAARVTHSVAQTVSTGGSGLALAFDTERFDTDTIHDTATQNTRLTATTAGVYLITGHIEVDAHATGQRLLGIRLNGTTFIARQVSLSNSGTSVCRLSIATIYKLAATNYVELLIFQDSGVDRTVNVTAQISPEFGMSWLGDG